MRKRNENPQNASPTPERREPDREPSTGQATRGLGNTAGQKAASQQGASGTIDQGGTHLRAGYEQKGGPLPENRGEDREGEQRS